MLSKNLLFLSGALLAANVYGQPSANSDALLARHHEDDSEHSHDHGDSEEGHDHGDSEDGHDHGEHGDHSMDFGEFEFTETDLVWPGCIQDCVHEFMEFLEPVDHPLCVNEDYYNNVTSCVVEDCSEYEQGVYAVVTEIECPDEEDFTLEAVTQTLTDNGGAPQECHSMEGEIHCDNGTEAGMENEDGEDAGMTSVPLGQQTLVLGAVLMTIPLAIFF